MQKLMKSLLVLACLVPNLAAASTETDTGFVRIQRDEDREPVALQTAITRYVPASGKGGLEVDLVAVVHVGDRRYYERLNKVLDTYDAVLYELVAPQGTRPPRGGDREINNPISMLQEAMKVVLRLEHQMAVVDYQQAHFVHADLSLAGIRDAIKKRGEDELTVFFRVVREIMEKVGKESEKPQAPGVDLLEILLDPSKLKRTLAEQLAKAGGDIGFGETFNQSLVVDRNLACLEVLRKQMQAGRKRIAIFYGAAHMPDFDKRLKEDFGLKRTSSQWLNAWKL